MRPIAVTPTTSMASDISTAVRRSSRRGAGRIRRIGRTSAATLAACRPLAPLSATFIEPGPDAGDRLRVQATTESGFDLGFDTLSASEGGIGPGPTETILASLAACTAMDVASILRKKRQRVESYRIAGHRPEGRSAPAGLHRRSAWSTRSPGT